MIVGESVTFGRTATESPPESKPSAQPVRTADREPDLILVGCVKKKLPTPAAAKDLYISALFHKERTYAERAGVPWFVLFAEHGLVAPEDVLAPYDLQLEPTSKLDSLRVLEEVGVAAASYPL